MTPRERVFALAAACVIAAIGRSLLSPPPAGDPVPFTPVQWCYPEESPLGGWATDRRLPPEAVRVMLVARDAVTAERLHATLAARPIDGTFAQTAGGAQVAYWDLPAGMEMVFAGSTTGHYSASGYRMVPEVPGSALAMTAWLLPRPAPLAGTVQPNDTVQLLRPEPAPDEWSFVDRLRASGLATAGLEEAWRQVFGSAIAVPRDGNWSHSCFPGLPLVVQVTPPRGGGKGPVQGSVMPIRDINRVEPMDVVGAGEGGAHAIQMPPYPKRWPPAHISLRAVSEAGRPLEATVRVLYGPGGGGGADVVAQGTGSLEFAIAPRAQLTLEVSAPGHEPRRVPFRMEPGDRWWVPEFVLERAE